MSTNKTKSKTKRKVPVSGILTIRATLNNTIVTFTDDRGDAIASCSAGVHCRGAKKSTRHAAQMAAKQAATKVMEYGMRAVDVVIRGIGSGREAVIRAVVAAGLNVKSITDKTSIPHNGCKPPKRRSI